MVNKIPQMTYDTLKLDFKQVSKQQHSCIGLGRLVGWFLVHQLSWFGTTH